MVVRTVQCVASPTVLLDLDGTLVDSATGITEHLSSALADYFEVTAPTRLADRPAPRPDLSPMMVGDRRHEVHGAAAHRLSPSECPGPTPGRTNSAQLELSRPPTPRRKRRRRCCCVRTSPPEGTVVTPGLR